MPCNDYIDVRILVDGLPLQEYAIHDEHPDTASTLTRYVEVKAGQQFAVQVKWLTGFNLRFAPFLYYSFALDDHGISYFNDFNCKKISHKKGFLQNDFRQIHDEVHARDKSTNRWQLHAFEFGALGFNDNAKTDLTADALSSLGSIRLRCYRAERVKLSTPHTIDGELPRFTSEIPEKLLKGKSIKNNITYTAAATPCSDPGPVYYEYVPMNGPHGMTYNFNFLYRSRKILQTLGCIPYSPSPPPDPHLMLERTEEMLLASKQANRAYNLRILELQKLLDQSRPGDHNNRITNADDDDDDDELTIVTSRSVNTSVSANTAIEIKREASLPKTQSPFIKPEPLPTPPTSSDTNKANTTTSTPQVPQVEGPRGTKRARDDDDDDDLAEIAPPPRKPRIEIDLTENNEA